MKKSIEECNCICHRNPGGVRHCMPCCTICPVCGKNIRIMHIQTHIERCRKENKDMAKYKGHNAHSFLEYLCNQLPIAA